MCHKCREAGLSPARRECGPNIVINLLCAVEGGQLSPRVDSTIVVSVVDYTMYYTLRCGVLQWTRLSGVVWGASVYIKILRFVVFEMYVYVV